MGDLHSICMVTIVMTLAHLIYYRKMGEVGSHPLLPYSPTWYPIHGLELSVVGHVQLVRFKAADNRDNGMEIQELMVIGGDPL